MWNKSLKISAFLVMTGIAGAFCFGQNPDQVQDTAKQMQELLDLRKELKDIKAAKQPTKFFKLDFVLREMDGSKVVNARSYSMFSGTATIPSSIRTGVKVQEGDTEHPNWTDIGVRIDVREIREVGSDLAFYATTEITGLPQDSITGPARPIMRQYVWSSEVLIPIKKPTVIFSSDSTTSKTQMQVELTATPVSSSTSPSER